MNEASISELALELMSTASCQVLERRHHNRGPNTGSPAPGRRKRGEERKKILIISIKSVICFDKMVTKHANFSIIRTSNFIKWSTPLRTYDR